MRWIVRIIVALVVCVVVVVGALFMLPTDRIGQLASDQLERQTGRKLTLSGDFRPTLYPTLGVKTGPVTISNAQWAADPTMISAQGVSVGVNLSALIGGGLEIEKIDLAEPVIYLERAKDGRVNWDMAGKPSQGGATPSTNETAQSAPPSLELGRITNGQIIFRDQMAGKTYDLSEINGTFSLPKGKPSVSVDMSARFDGKSGALKTTLADWKALTTNGFSEFDGNFSLSDANLSLGGSIGLPDGKPSLDARILGNIPAPATLAKSVGVSIPAQVAQLTNVAIEGKIQLSPKGFSLNTNTNGTYAAQPVQVSALVTGAESWMQDPAFDASVKVALAGANTVAFDGRLNGAKTLASGAVQSNISDLRGLLNTFGVSLSTPAGTLKSAKLSGQLHVGRAGGILLNGAKITLDQNTVEGTIKLNPSTPPLIEASLTAGNLDVSAFTSDKSSTGGSSNTSGSSQTGWSKDPISLAGLDTFDADIDMKAKGVDLGVTKLGLTNISAKLRGGKLNLNLRDVQAFQGAMSGAIAVRGGNSVSFSSDVTAKSVQLKPLLGQLLEIDRLSGSGDTHLKLSGSGNSLYAIMHSLSGSGDVKFANGAIKGIDLAAMMRNLKKAFGGFEGATEFTSLTGSFSMEKGVLQNVDLSLVSPLFKAAGKGSVDIGGQAMNYIVTPTSLAKDAEFSVPVSIIGPWNDLKFRPDLTKLIDLLANTKLKDNAQVKKAKEKLDSVKAKLKDPETTIKAKIAKELNAGQGTGQKSLEDVAKDKVGNALKKLFD